MHAYSQANKYFLDLVKGGGGGKLRFLLQTFFFPALQGSANSVQLRKPRFISPAPHKILHALFFISEHDIWSKSGMPEWNKWDYDNYPCICSLAW